MSPENGNLLAIQIGSDKPAIRENVTEEEILKIIGEKSPTMAERLQETSIRLSNIQKEVLTDPDNVVDYYLLQAAQAHADQVVNDEFQDLPDDERIKKIDGYHRYTSIGSSLLYTDAGFGGSTKFFSITWPNMNWWPYRFNDRASSARAWGGNILFEHSWYRGRRLYLIGLPFVQFDNLSVFNFNDIASSFVSLP